MAVATNRILKEAVAPVDEQIAPIQMRPELRDEIIDGLARLHHQDDLPRPHERADELLDRIGRLDPLACCRAARKPLRLRGGAVEYRYRKAVPLDVQHEILAHDGQTDEPDFLIGHRRPPASTVACPRDETTGNANGRTNKLQRDGGRQV